MIKAISIRKHELQEIAGVTENRTGMIQRKGRQGANMHGAGIRNCRMLFFAVLCGFAISAFIFVMPRPAPTRRRLGYLWFLL